MKRKQQPVSRAELRAELVALVEELEGVVGPLHRVVDWGLALRLQSARRKLPGFKPIGDRKFESPAGRAPRPRIRKTQAMKLAASATQVFLLSLRLDRGFFSPN
jgi:hypothetical protein